MAGNGFIRLVDLHWSRQKAFFLGCMLMALVTAAVAITNLTQSGADSNAAVVDQAQVESARAAAAPLNAFGAKLVAQMAPQRPQRNLFISPLSVFAALAMAENGADGHTREAMRQAMSVPGSMNEQALHQGASDLLRTLRAQKGVELSIANALWSDPRDPLSPDFVQRCRDLYQAEARTVDFRQASSITLINNWVKEKTQGKITQIISDLEPDLRAVLTNAVYFHGKWAHEFPKAQTQPADFHLAAGQSKKVKMMHQDKLEDAYRSGPGYEAAALDYRSSHMRMYAILPAAGVTPEETLEKISVQSLEQPGVSNELDLRLPRFTLDFSADLNGPLKGLGMGVAFQPGQAEFAPIGSSNFYIGDVVHKTRVEVDEEGTVAAAATGIKIMAASMRPAREKKTLVFDRPFAVMLCDTLTGAVLFEGVIYDPTL